MPGKLFIVATPIGNLEDITLRALRTLKEVDLIACEDTRHTRKLLTHFEIHKPLISYHEHNERTRSKELIEALLSGKNVAVVSDAGTPGISDPGADVISAAIDAGIEIIPIPGPSALITALIASGLPTHAFRFIGFLPAKSTVRKAKLEQLVDSRVTLIFYESPHRLERVIEDLFAAFGNRRAVIARELTKVHEEFKRGFLADFSAGVNEQTARGEYVIIVEGNTSTESPQTGTIVEQVNALIENSGLSKKDAIKQIARLNGLSKSEVYQQVVNDKSEGITTETQSHGEES
jgi:16S rRNA (cytidine1402-2'-O)-methyltransferase